MMKLTRRHSIKLMSAAAGAASISGLSVLPATSQTVLELMEEGPLKEMMIGDENAPVTIIEYASMTCPHCANFHFKTLPMIKEKYIDTGKARLIFREFPFDPRAMAAFMLMRCAPEDKYFVMADILFKQQSIWARAADPVPPLQNIAKLAGFSEEQFNACLKNQELLDKVLKIQKKASTEFKVDSTPTLFINGTRHTGNLSVEALSEAIDSEL